MVPENMHVTKVGDPVPRSDCKTVTVLLYKLLKNIKENNKSWNFKVQIQEFYFSIASDNMKKEIDWLNALFFELHFYLS